MDAIRDVPDQLPLFPKDGASDLARALLDTAWLVVQLRTLLSTRIIAELYTALAYFRERLAVLTHAERVARDILAGAAQRPRFGPVPRPAQPPTIARLAG
jgi:hypothetical protein